MCPVLVAILDFRLTQAKRNFARDCPMIIHVQIGFNTFLRIIQGTFLPRNNSITHTVSRKKIFQT
jgi:hypothetical protein